MFTLQLLCLLQAAGMLILISSEIQIIKNDGAAQVYASDSNGSGKWC